MLKSKIISIFLFLSSSLSWAQKPSDWDATTISYQDIQDYWTEEKCHETEMYFLACIFAINNVLDLAEKDFFSVLPGQEFLNGFANKYDYKKFAAFDSLIVTKYSPPVVKSEFEKVSFQQSYARFLMSAWLKFIEDEENFKSIKFTQLFDWVFKSFVPHHQINPRLAVAEFINGALTILNDVHSQVIPPQKVRILEGKIDDEMKFGLLYSKRGKYFSVNGVHQESSAYEFGILASDIITKINGQKAEELTLDHFNKISEMNTELNLEIYRHGEELNKTIIKTKVKHRSINFSVLNLSESEKFALLQVYSFLPGTCLEFEKSLEEINQVENIRGIILDLRNNPGGILGVTICMLEKILGGDKDLLHVLDLHRSSITDISGDANEKPLTKLPIVTLINSRSASAAEILAGSLRSHNATVLVGEKSFGKGSIQSMKKKNPFTKDPSVQFKVTTGLYILPNFKIIDQVGIQPDYEVFLSPNKISEHSIRNENLSIKNVSYSFKVKSDEENIEKPISEKINQCVKKSNAAKDKYFREETKGYIFDYQLLVAQDVLSCF